MSDHHRREVQPQMPINRRVGFLDKVLADAVDRHVDHPLHKPWQGGERGDPWLTLRCSRAALLLLHVPIKSRNRIFLWRE